MVETKEKLEKAISDLLDYVSSADPNDREAKQVIEKIVDLYQLKLREDELIAEIEEKEERRNFETLKFETETDFKQSQEDIQKKKDKSQSIMDYIKIGLTAAGIVLPIWFNVVWMKRGFEFERTGVYSSKTFGNLFKNFRPSK